MHLLDSVLTFPVDRTHFKPTFLNSILLSEIINAQFGGKICANDVYPTCVCV